MLLALNSLGKLFSIPSPSECRRTTRNQDPLLDLVNSSLSFETHTFLGSIIHLAALSTDPKSILNRFIVQRVTHRRDRPLATGTQRETVLLELIDIHRSGSRPLYMCLERTASVNQSPPPPSYFTEHPDSAAVLESIVQTLKEALAYLPTSVSGSNDFSPSLKHPSLHGHPSPPSTYQTIAATEAVHASTSKVYKSDDRFTGAKNIEVYPHAALNVCEIRPQSLSLFEFAVLADAVHKHDPLYSTLRSQPYWFASMICDIITKEYACTVVAGKQGPESGDDIFIPPNSYRPDLAGRWTGISVSRVKEAAATAIASNFRKYRREKREEVRNIWEEYHLAEQALKARVSRLEGVIRAHNFDPDENLNQAPSSLLRSFS